MWICAEGMEGGHGWDQSSLRKVDTMNILFWSLVLLLCPSPAPRLDTDRNGLIIRWIRASKRQCQVPREREMSGAVCPPGPEGAEGVKPPVQ